jgi:hypothetical protein
LCGIAGSGGGVPFGECLLLDFYPLLLKRRHGETGASGRGQGSWGNNILLVWVVSEGMVVEGVCFPNKALAPLGPASVGVAWAAVGSCAEKSWSVYVVQIGCARVNVAQFKSAAHGTTLHKSHSRIGPLPFIFGSLFFPFRLAAAPYGYRMNRTPYISL